MKAIINGRRYDTARATLVAEDGDGDGRDFRHWDEELYRTPKGAWFLRGRGGPLSRWAEHRSDGTHGGERIVPLGATEAREWLEEHRQLDALEEHFGSEVEDA